MDETTGLLVAAVGFGRTAAAERGLFALSRRREEEADGARSRPTKLRAAKVLGGFVCAGLQEVVRR
jgi:hypothetical protein